MAADAAGWEAAVEAMRSAELCEPCNRGAIREECWDCAQSALTAALPALLRAVVGAMAFPDKHRGNERFVVIGRSWHTEEEVLVTLLAAAGRVTGTEGER